MEQTPIFVGLSPISIITEENLYKLMYQKTNTDIFLERFQQLSLGEADTREMIFLARHLLVK